jgi:hypothetical protein
MRSMNKVLAMAALLLSASCHPASAGNESRSDAGAMAGPSGKAQLPVTGGVADPVKFVRDSYDPAGRAAFDAANPPGSGTGADAPASDETNSERQEFSPRLRALFLDDEKYADGQVGRLDFNPFSGANDDDIKGAKVTSEDVDGAPDRKIVTARFRNMSANQTITFFWERIGGRWYIDDIAGQAAGEPSGWTLSLILKYGRSGS